MTRVKSQRVAASTPAEKTAAPTTKAPAAKAISKSASKSTESTKSSTKVTKEADPKPTTTAKSSRTKSATKVDAKKDDAPKPSSKPRSAKSDAPVKPVAKSASKKRKAEDTDSADERPAKRTTLKAEKAAPKVVAPKPAPKAAPKVVAPKPAPKAAPKAAPKPAPKVPKPKAVPTPKAAKPVKALPVINERPTERFQVLVNGEGSAGELGLGPGDSSIDVKRARLNTKLDGETVGVVQLACGGMHTIALTHDGKILTWGVNDDGALGRNTDWDGGVRDVADEDEDGDLNPIESKPLPVPADKFPVGTNIVQVTACDSASFVLTDTGLVYGWGIFRDSGGNWGFTLKDGKVVGHQREPMLIPGLTNIVRIVGSQNFALALDKKGVVYGWGNGQQNELGHRIVERRRTQSLLPTVIGLPRNKIKDIAVGAFHAFAISKTGEIWAWGANNFGQTGIPDLAGDGNASIVPPRKVAALADRVGHDLQISGGNHHSVLLDRTTGEVLTWGRTDGHQVGFTTEQLEDIAAEDENAVIRDSPPDDDAVEPAKPTGFSSENMDTTSDEEKADDKTEAETAPEVPRKIRILLKPTVVELGQKATYAHAGQEHNQVVGEDGKLYTWGFNANFQCGVGHTDDVVEPSWAGSKDLKNQTVIKATGGSQFSIVLAKWPRVEEDGDSAPKTNGKSTA